MVAVNAVASRFITERDLTWAIPTA